MYLQTGERERNGEREMGLEGGERRRREAQDGRGEDIRGEERRGEHRRKGRGSFMH